MEICPWRISRFTWELTIAGASGAMSGGVVRPRSAWIASAQRLALFGRRLAWQRLRHYSKAKSEVILSDGDEGLETGARK